MNSAQLIISLTNLVIGLAEAVISLRIALKFFGVNAAAPFVQWVYATSDSLLYPFQGMFPSTHLPEGFVIEFSAFFGLIVYALFGYILEELVGFFETRRVIITETVKRK